MGRGSGRTTDSCEEKDNSSGERGERERRAEGTADRDQVANFLIRRESEENRRCSVACANVYA